MGLERKREAVEKRGRRHAKQFGFLSCRHWGTIRFGEKGGHELFDKDNSGGKAEGGLEVGKKEAGRPGRGRQQCRTDRQTTGDREPAF